MGPIITLTTDFGEDSPYVAAMKGVILGINPAALLMDLSHQVRPQDVRHAAFFLAEALPCFPPGVIHVVVVDPGVGSERALLVVELGGHRLLLPDNGCWTALAEKLNASPVVWRLTEPSYWRQPVSQTFHGRDILAPVAAHLSLGTEPSRLGLPVTDWVRLDLPRPVRNADSLRGEVLFVDGFGNLLTNVPGDAYLALAARPVRIAIGPHVVPQRVRTYAEAAPGTVVALVSSAGLLEIAVVQGNAAQALGVGVGTAASVVTLPAASGAGG